MSTIVFGSARHDENGKYVGGQEGDQLQKISADGYDWNGEVSTQKAYMHSKGWYVLRAKDPSLANGLAFAMAIACINKNIGYNQYENSQILKYGVTANVPVNCDCSKLVEACIEQCGHKIPSFTTANEKDVLLATGLFILVEIKSLSELCIGDILVTKVKGHTVIVVSGAINRYIKHVNPYLAPTSIVRKGDRGDEVRWVQTELNECGATLKVDGVFGDNTYKAVKAYQKAHGLEIDGIVGEKTIASLKK